VKVIHPVVDKVFFSSMAMILFLSKKETTNYKTTKYYYCLLIKTLLTYIKNINLWQLKCVTEVLV